MAMIRVIVGQGEGGGLAGRAGQGGDGEKVGGGEGAAEGGGKQRSGGLAGGSGWKIAWG